MTLSRHGKTLDVYLEADESHNPEYTRSACQESEISKISFSNVLNPEWAVSVLRHLRYIKQVVDFGASKDERYYALKVIFEGKEVQDLRAFKTLVRYAIENTNLHETHL